MKQLPLCINHFIKHVYNLLLLSLLFVEPTIAQNKIEEPSTYVSFIKQFKDDFNTGNYHHIVTYSSASFLKSVPEKRLTEFLSGIRNDYGEIVKLKFKYFDQKHSAVYHTELKKTWMNFIIGLDSSNMIKRLVVLDPNYNEDLPVVINKTKMQLPFDSTWYVFWGGETEDENYHVTVRSQKNAFDFVIRDSTNKSYRTDGKSNEDYYCFSRAIYAPCSGEIVMVTDSVHDNIPGEMNPAQLTGNSIIIKSKQREYILMAHFKMNSILVKKGDKIKAGQLIGLCGNSGNSSEPHVHLHIMDAPSLKEGTGIKCNFQKLTVNGEIKLKYSPVKGERISKLK